MFLLVVFLLTIVVHCGIGIGVVVDVDFYRQEFENLLLRDGVTEENGDLSFEDVELMDHVSQGVSILLTLTDHAGNVIPRVPIVLHRLYDLYDRIHIGYVLLNVFSFQLVNVLLLLQFTHSNILVLLYLVVLLPCYPLHVLLIVMLVLLVICIVLPHCLIESLKLSTRVITILSILIRRKLKILHPFL